MTRLLRLCLVALVVAFSASANTWAQEADTSVCDPAQASKKRSAHVLSTARVNPYWVEGRFIGIQISGIEENSPLLASGIQNGDLVIEASGARLADVEKATAFFCLIGVGRRFQFKVRRSNGEIEALTFPASK